MIELFELSNNHLQKTKLDFLEVYIKKLIEKSINRNKGGERNWKNDDAFTIFEAIGFAKFSKNLYFIR